MTLASCFLGAGTGTSPNASLKKLIEETERLKKDPDLAHASWGYCVKYAAKDSVLASYNSQLSLVPASTLKILTTGAALFMLGPQYKYETQLQYDGVLDSVSGVLDGNIYIKGSGDPSLGSAYFADKKDTLGLPAKWAALIRAKGIKKVTGCVVGDDDAFESEMIPSTWIWGDMGNYYGAGACGLSFMDNKYTVYFKSNIIRAQPATVKRIVPEIPGLSLKNNVTSGPANSGDNAYIYGAPYSYERYMTGTIPVGKDDYDVEGSMPDPAMFCAWSLKNALEKAGTKVEKGATTRRLALDSIKGFGRNTIYRHLSPELSKIVYYTNMKSNNHYAESLLKTIALAKNGWGEDNAGTDLVLNLWASKGVPVKGIYMNDGSGLSRANAISPEAETEVLRAIAADTTVFRAFYNSLPPAGAFAEGTFADNNMRVKSGYITRARSYTGYVKNRKGKLLAFSVILNNYDCSPAEARVKLGKLMVLFSELE